MIGFAEIIVLLLSIGGFGLTPNPTPPTPDQSLAYAAPEADLIVHFDAATVVPGNYKSLIRLGEEPAIKNTPQLRDMVRQIVGQVEGGRGMAKGLLGLDVTTDIASATVFLQFVAQRDPNFVLAVRGKFPADMVSKAAQLSGGAASKIDSSWFAEVGSGNSIGLTKDGVLLVGTPSWVKPRLADKWNASARATGSTMAKMAEVLAGKPFFAVGGALSPSLRTRTLAEMKSQNFASDLIKRHKFFALGLYVDGIGWRWDDSTKVGLDNMKLFSEGMIELMRAGQVAPRGVAKMAAAAMESYRGMNKQIDELIRRKDELVKLVEGFSGDGKFAATVNTDPRTLRLDVRASAARFSQVVPVGLVLPFMGAAYFGMASSSTAPQPVMMEQAAPPPTKTSPVKKVNPPKVMQKTTH